MKLLVFGRTGQVATELARATPVRGIDADYMGRNRADLTDPSACADIVARTDADIIINAAAYTAVDAAETDEATAQLVNGDAPGAMARAAAARGLPFLHISTDYVFPGGGTDPWTEDMATGPLGAYGRTKLSGEEQVRAAGGDHVILRTAWVFSAHGKNFVKTMLHHGALRNELTVVDDQRGGPTAAADIALTLVTIAQAFHDGRGVSGTFHYAGSPACTWADFAEAIFAGSSLPKKPTVKRIPTSAYPTPAVRPPNSVLDCTRVKATYGIEQPDWQMGLARVLKELETSK
ncbi:MAG: dTDP-4-dehydrorhamnose reductase [Paracoccaceae bacterium]